MCPVPSARCSRSWPRPRDSVSFSQGDAVKLKNLDEVTRHFMRIEVQYDISTGSLYIIRD